MLKAVDVANLLKEVTSKKMKKQYKQKGKKMSGVVIKKNDFIDICNAHSTLSIQTISAIGPILSLTENQKEFFMIRSIEEMLQ